jgi:HSP20 family molecular chaperone IbpA
MAEETVERGSIPAQRPEETPATREPERYLTPAVDIYETDDALTVVADMPGVGKDDVDVRLEDDVLSIVGTLSHPQRANPTYEEYGLLNYHRQFRLNEAVDRDNIQAELKQGVLTLTLPKTEAAKPRQIKVNVT